MKRFLILTLIVAFCIPLMASSTFAQAVDAPEKPKAEKTDEKKKRKKPGVNEEFGHFMRIRRDEKRKPVAMETSVTRYIGKDADGKQVIVDLIGVVHIGEKSYYEQLNKEFEQYDALLYELVAPEGPSSPKVVAKRQKKRE